MPAGAQEAPAKWGPGCNKALIEGEFSLAKAPEIACDPERKAYIDEIIADVKDRGSRMVGGDDLKMDNPEFTAFFLRAFADPGEDLKRYAGPMYRLSGRFAHGRDAKMLNDARLDWDIWRAWLLFENTAYTKDVLFSTIHLHCAREVLWRYLSVNAAGILKDPQRRAWWLTRLTAGLEAPGGRPQRRWFLLLLLAREDPKREALLKTEVKPVYSEWEKTFPSVSPIRLIPFLSSPDKKHRYPPLPTP